MGLSHFGVKLMNDINIETLRKRIADETFRYEDFSLKITVTIGVSAYDCGLNNDAWISEADEKLYYGKNQVVM